MRGATAERRPRCSRSAGVVSLAVARGTGGVAATSRRQPGRCGGQPLPGGAVPSAPAHRTGRARLLAPGEAADGSTRAHRDGASACRARAPRPRRRTAIRARSGGDGDRAPRRRAGCRAAVVVLQPDPIGPGHPADRRGRTARRARCASRARGGNQRRRAAPRGDRRLEPRLRPRLASRPCRPRRRADDRGRDDRGTHEHGLAARVDAHPPAVLSVRVRTRARASPRAPAAEARLPPAVHDQPRRRVARPGAGLRPLRPGARVRGPARPTRLRPADWAVPRLDLREAPRPRPGPGPGCALGGGRLLRRADRVRRRLQGQRRHLPPAAAVGEHAAARPRRARAGPQVPDRERGGHAAAGRDQVRVADRDPVRVRRPGPHRRAAEPLRRAAPQPHAADRRPLGIGQDDEQRTC